MSPRTEMARAALLSASLAHQAELGLLFHASIVGDAVTLRAAERDYAEAQWRYYLARVWLDVCQALDEAESYIADTLKAHGL